MAKSIRSKSKRKNRAILRKEVYEPAQRERQATCDKRLLVDTYLKGNKSLDLIGKALTSATPVVDQPNGDVKIGIFSVPLSISRHRLLQEAQALRLHREKLGAARS